ncbi:SGNH/GDSL hydrolase family protein [Acidicapsa ligni]|uniref:SGNH/GDSL hydrolase family protein n=1 Tax=Acidicapsa ligni TaxID=542300 RepID=UPI0021E0E021|nr:SGNH/GDSL hydrolase family protein [Acidicapsa ligni]
MPSKLHTSGILTVLFFVSCIITPAQAPSAKINAKPFYLHDGDTVVFYGDSITEQRYYTYWIEFYTATRFPHMQVQFFNAGYGGDRVTGGGGGPVDERLARDVFPHKPTVVTIMLGMNDGGYQPLNASIENDYTKGYEHILTSIQQTLPTTRISLFGPSPYDEITRRTKILGGYNPTLVRFSELDKGLAAKYHATYIDLNAPFVKALKRGTAINPLAIELLLPDKIHPEQLAHWFMALPVLKGWNAPSIVSSLIIDADKATIIEQTNTHIADLHKSDLGLTWTALDDALPLPLDDTNPAQHFLRQLIDIEEQLNQQPLQIHKLKAGLYQLMIDGKPTAKITAQEFEKGINLADLDTPMRGQSNAVGWTIRDRDSTHYVRSRMLVSQMKTGISEEQGVRDLIDFEQVQQKMIYELAQPKPHTFQVLPIEGATK